VLLVDDEEDIRRMLRIHLDRDDRFEVVGEATNGQEALDLCAEVKADVVVLDLRMPVLDGMAALPLLLEQCPDAEVAVYSAFGDDARRAEAERLGAAAFLEKGEPLPWIAARLASIAP
jgi:DNA-binding NarL/FixJ family response regulator